MVTDIRLAALGGVVPGSPGGASTAGTRSTAALVRHATDGLAAALASFRAGQLPPHRFVWELAARIDTLDELAGALPTRLPTIRRTVSRLRWIQRGIAARHTDSAPSGRAELTADEQSALTLSVVSLRLGLAQLAPSSSCGPAGAARPATPAPAVRALRCVN